MKPLPPDVYLDPTVLGTETDAVFGTTWQHVGHVEKVRSTGDYLVCEVAGESVIVIRGHDEVLHGHINVCRHRGSQLAQGTGCTSRLSCPYHGWSYDLDGSLVTVPNERAVGVIDRAGHGLHRVQVVEVHGLVFVNLDLTAPAFDHYAPGLENEIRAYAPELPALTFAHRTEATIAANWKVAIENYSECYHCRLVHKEFVKGVADPDSYRLVDRGHWQRHESRARTGAAKAYEFDETATHTAGEFGAWWLWPNFAFQSYPGGAVHTWKWTPIDISTTHVVVDWFLPSAEPADWERDLIDHHARTTFAEDIPIVESVQRGISSRRYVPGPIMVDPAGGSMSEHGVEAIQRLWREAMGNDR